MSAIIRIPLHDDADRYNSEPVEESNASLGEDGANDMCDFSRIPMT